MGITARELNRATLARQLLLEREPLGVVDAVRRLVALQAQHPASPYLALWNRLRDFAPADLDTAFAGHAVVKATLMRITLHAVHADDWPAFRAAMQPSTRSRRTPGTPSPPKPPPCRSCSPTVNRRSTAATTTGGATCRRPKPAYCQHDHVRANLTARC